MIVNESRPKLTREQFPDGPLSCSRPSVEMNDHLEWNSVFGCRRALKAATQGIDRYDRPKSTEAV
jgi:hypothetical protein